MAVAYAQHDPEKIEQVLSDPQLMERAEGFEEEKWWQAYGRGPSAN